MVGSILKSGSPSLAAIMRYLLFPLWIGLMGAVHAGGVFPLVTAEFPPYNYQKGDKIIGSSTEIIEAVFERMQMESEIKLFPSKRAMKMAAKGRSGGYFTFTKNPQRLEDYYYSLPLSTIGDVFFKRRDLTVDWKRLVDLAGYRIGATQGYNYAPEFLDAVRSKSVDVEMIASKMPEMAHLKRLKAGRVDLIICEVTLCSHIIRTHPEEFGGIDYVDRLVGPVRTFHLGFSKRWPNAKAVAEKFNQTLNQLLEEGVVAAIHQKYGTRRDLPARQ